MSGQPIAVHDLGRGAPYPAGRCRSARNGRAGAVVFASEALPPSAVGDRSIWQVANVATLPGIVRASQGDRSRRCHGL